MKRFKHSVFSILLSLLLTAAGVSAQTFDHSTYDRLLKTYVSDGLVNYSALKANDMPKLEGYLGQLAQEDEKEFLKWDNESQIAYWINAYNAITLYGILINYPIQFGGIISRIRFPQSSIRQIKDFWDIPFSPVNGDKTITLNTIEHEILRRQYDEPRIHFALVCASMGCPLLLSEAYQPGSLDEQLDGAARGFIRSPGKNYLDKEQNILYLSSIFKWYAEDFKTSSGDSWLKNYPESERGVMDFITVFVENTTKNHIVLKTPEIKYLEYDWSLNEQK